MYRQKINKKLVMPTLMFMRQEKSSGIVLGIAVIIALLLANSPWREQYFEFFEHHLGFVFDGKTYFNFSLEHWINDGLMSSEESYAK